MAEAKPQAIRTEIKNTNAFMLVLPNAQGDNNDGGTVHVDVGKGTKINIGKIYYKSIGLCYLVNQ